MLPFTIRYNRTIKESVTPEQINELLDFSKGELDKKDANLVLRDYYNKNCLRFKNRVLSLGPNWTLMAGVDSGFFRIDETKNNHTKVTYSFTVITGWIIYLIIFIIVLISTRDKIGLLMLLIGGLLAWLIGLVRHWIFFIEITNDIKGLILKDKK
jgi:hypothetical protein